MTLAEFALLVGTDPKWVLNASVVLRIPARYSLAAARRLTVARSLRDAAGMPLPRAYGMAGEALRRYAGEGALVTLTPDASTVELRVDVHRLLCEFNVRHSQLKTMHARRRPGPRASTRRDPLRAASDYGIDLSLLRANLRRTPAERLRQLDGMAAFARHVRRAVPAEPA